MLFSCPPEKLETGVCICSLKICVLRAICVIRDSDARPLVPLTRGIRGLYFLSSIFIGKDRRGQEVQKICVLRAIRIIRDSDARSLVPLTRGKQGVCICSLKICVLRAIRIIRDSDARSLVPLTRGKQGVCIRPPRFRNPTIRYHLTPQLSSTQNENACTSDLKNI